MVEFQVDDMISNLCAGTIADAVKTVDQDAVVEIHLGEHLVRIDSVLAAEEVEFAIRNAGYSPATAQLASR